MPTVKIAGTRVGYLEWGSGGETVVLLHSSGSSASQWRTLGAELGARYRVMAPDLYGYGDTSHWPGRKPFHLEAEAELVSALLARAHVPVHLVGHSYGGAVALHVAGRHAELLRSLTLIEPAAFHLLKGTDSAAFAEIADVAEGVVRAVARGEHIEGFGRFVDYWSGPGAWDAVSTDRRAAMAACLPKVALEFHAAFNEPTRLEDFRAMTVPTLLLRGTGSPAPGRRICELLAATLARATLSTIAGAGHMAPVTHRDPVNTLITAQIDANSTQVPGHTFGNYGGPNAAGALPIAS